MNIFKSLYRTITRNRFTGKFKPLGIPKNKTILVSAPQDPPEFLKALSFIGSVRKIAPTVVLVDHNLDSIYSLLKPHLCTFINYSSPLELFTKQQTQIENQLVEKTVHLLIELNTPASKALPYMVPAQKRISFYDMQNYPYYNIMMKDGYQSLHDFFNIEPEDPRKLFRIYKREKKAVLHRFKKNSPLLIVNNRTDINWEGDTIVVGIDISFSDPDIFRVAFHADAYTGEHDVLYEFARMFNKQIIE
jgi:hypothetical protein